MGLQCCEPRVGAHVGFGQSSASTTNKSSCDRRCPQIYLPTSRNCVHGTHTGVFSIDGRNWCGIVDDALTRQDSLGQDSLSGIPVRHCGAGVTRNLRERIMCARQLHWIWSISLVTPSMTYLTTSFLLLALRSLLYEHVFGTSSGLSSALQSRYYHALMRPT